MKTGIITVFVILCAALALWLFLPGDPEIQTSTETARDVKTEESFIPLQADTPDTETSTAASREITDDTTARSGESAYIDRHRDELSSQSYEVSMMAFLDLIRHLHENPEEFDAVLAALKRDPDLARKVAMFADAVVHEPEGNLGRELLLAAARDLLTAADDPAIRNFALATLSKFPPPDLDTIELVARASREGSFDETHTAAFALANWLHDPNFRTTATNELIRTAQASTDPDLRSYAIGEIVAQNPDMPPSVWSAVNDYLEAAPPPEYRLAVASTLATANESVHSYAIEQIQTTYLDTSNVELRRSALTALALYGGEEAVAWARQHPADHSLLAQDLEDYAGILSRGIVDPNEILQLKEEVENERAIRRYNAGR